MKIKTIIVNLSLFAVLFVSCARNEIEKTINNSKQMRFTIVAEGDQTITTRSADVDNSISDVYVLVFEGNSDNDKLKTWHPATSSGSNVYFASIPEGTVGHFTVLANSEALILKHESQWKTNPPTFAEVKRTMVVTELKDANGYITHNPDISPMSSDLIPYTGTATLYEATIVRATAKVSIQMGGNVNHHYKLSGFNLCNAPTSGNVFDIGPNTTAFTHYAGQSTSDGTYSLSEVMGKAIEPDYLTTQSLYLYEMSAKKEPYVIVKGLYDGTVGYHRLNIWNRKGVYYDIKRNFSYLIKIDNVYTAGYATVEEAMANPASNRDINVDIEVADGTSRDIVSNGDYYLGVSNSELILYENKTLDNYLVTIVKTDADNKQLSSISAKVTDGNTSKSITVNDPFLSPDGKLLASIPAGVIAAEITIRVGELSRKIRIKREFQNISIGGAILLKKEFVYGKITSDNGENNWIKLSDNADPKLTNGVTEYVREGNERDLYLVLDNNMKLDELTPEREMRGAEIILSKANDDGHTKIVLEQPPFNIFDKVENDIASIKNPYVGAFWKSTQTGERVINMTISSTGNKELLTWDATVAMGDSWIGLELGKSSDPAIGTANPAFGNDPDFESKYQLKTLKTMIQADGTETIFRIGLKSKIGKMDHRYGLVIVNTYYEGVHQSSYRVLIRQGDSPDYVFRDGDSGTGIGWNGKRPKATKISAYNLTDELLGKGAVGTSDNIEKHNKVALDYNTPGAKFRRTKFTDYPSQAGYFFLWNIGATTASSDIVNRYMRAFHPVNSQLLNSLGDLYDTADPPLGGSIPLIFDDKGDPCPIGYRVPSGGTVVPGKITNTAIEESELMQSIMYHLYNPDGAGGVAEDMSKYTLWGYYADGFFDRLKVKQYNEFLRTGSSASRSKIVGMVVKGEDLRQATGNDIGYIGQVLFNPYTLSSIFIPACGYVDPPFSANSAWILNLAEEYSLWTRERRMTDPNVQGNYPISMGGQSTYFLVILDQGVTTKPRSIRCVRDHDETQDYWETE